MYADFYPIEIGSTNNLVLQTLPEFSSESPDYTIVAQDAIEVQDVLNGPAVSMGVFLVAMGQMNIFPTISSYARDGYDRKAHAATLYEYSSTPCLKDIRHAPKADRNPTSTTTLGRACVRSAILASDSLTRKKKMTLCGNLYYPRM